MRHVQEAVVVIALSAAAAAQDPQAPPAPQEPQAPPATQAPQEPPDTAPASPAAAEGEPWTFSFSAYSFTVPDDTNYVMPVITADRGWLHLEGRYNYEDIDTGSVWFGYNLSFGEEEGIALDVTPMVGGVFGQTNGIAPGYEASLRWRRLELYSEGEYLFDVEESSDSFFYTWSELTLAPTDWLRVGYLVQRTKVYETDFEIQRGFLVGVTFESVDVTFHMLNPDESHPVYVWSVGLSH